MGAGASVVAANGGSPPHGTVGCRGGGGEGFELKVGMLKETPLGKVLSETDLAYFSAFFTVETLAPHARVPMGAGELLVVGEGEVQVYVVQAGLDARTGEQSFVLCSKRKGDLIWVPSMHRLAKQKSGGGLGGGSFGDGADGLTVAEEGARREEVETMKHKDLYNVMDTTMIMAPFGATLLKLDRQRYEQLTSGGAEQEMSLDLTSIRRVIDCNMEDYLRKVSLFKHLPANKLAVLGEMCNYEFVKAGQRVCSEGEAGSEIYIVLDGKLCVSTQGKGAGEGKDQDVRLATLGPGDYFGELAALIRIKRIATVVADEPSLLASIKRHDFRSFMTILPGVRAAMDKVVKEHLIFKYARVGNRFFPPPSTSTTTTTTTTEPSSPTSSTTTTAEPKPSSSSPSSSPSPSCAFESWEVEDVDPERILLYEGDETAAVYYLSEGKVRLHRSSSGSSSNDSNESFLLGPGSLIGARAAILGEAERFTVVTDKGGPCVFLKLGLPAMRRHMESHPVIRASLEMLFRRRRTPLATVLECPEGRKAFAAHLQEEFTAEHLTFHDDLLAFHAAAADPSTQRRLLQQLHEAYFAPAAPSPLNIPDTMRRRFLGAYDTAANQKFEDEAGMAEVLRALGDVKREVLALLERDNYARFKNTEAFASMLSSLAALLPTEPLLDETVQVAARKGTAAAGGRSVSPTVKQDVEAA